MEVGEICCDNLTSTELASDHMESLRRYLSRRKRFVSSKRWTAFAAGIHSIKHNLIHLEIAQTGARFKLRMNKVQGKKIFDSLINAKSEAFDIIESGEASAFFEKHNASIKRKARRSQRA